MSDLSKENNLTALRWLLEAGADEAVLEAPVDRLAPPAPRAAEPPPMRPQPPVPPLRAPSIAKKAEAVSLSTAPGAARALAASCTTLAELRAALEGFEGCALKRSAKTTVFADGNPQARIMCIGEAPGRDEDREGRPFVGRAGKLLDQMLSAIGLDRTTVYIANILPWRPPENRDPSPEEGAICLPFLRRQIELVDPEILVLLGAVSVRHLLGFTEGIMRTRGRWEIYQTDKRAIPAMPTLHPAYLLRQPIAKRLAWRDLVAISAKAEEIALG